MSVRAPDSSSRGERSEDVVCSVKAKASPEKAFACVVAIFRHGEWSTIDLEPLTRGRIQVGSRYMTTPMKPRS